MTTSDQNNLTDYTPDGVDLTLIRWMLSLTPAERLEVAEQRANEILAIRQLNDAPCCRTTVLNEPP